MANTTCPPKNLSFESQANVDQVGLGPRTTANCIFAPDRCGNRIPRRLCHVRQCQKAQVEGVGTAQSATVDYEFRAGDQSTASSARCVAGIHVLKTSASSEEVIEGALSEESLFRMELSSGFRTEILSVYRPSSEYAERSMQSHRLPT